MLFFTFNKADLCFNEKKFILKSDTIVKTLYVIKQVKKIDESKFAMAVLDLEDKSFELYVVLIIKSVYCN